MVDEMNLIDHIAGEIYMCLLSFPAAYSGVLSICMSFKLTFIFFKKKLNTGNSFDCREPKQLFQYLHICYYCQVYSD